MIYIMYGWQLLMKTNILFDKTLHWILLLHVTSFMFHSAVGVYVCVYLYTYICWFANFKAKTISN